MQDKFDEYLKDKEKPTRLKALTAKSYRNLNHALEDSDTNSTLATYGDAILKLAYCKILFDEGETKITERKQALESDKNLVEVIAKRYDLLNYIKFDNNDTKIPQDYKYQKPQKGKDSPSKYIATAVEALIAAIYLDNDEDLDLVVDIVKDWRELIENK